MLKINMEYRKGILFIRLKGELNKFTYQSLNNYLIPVINKQGIKYIVYNLANVNIMDNYGTASIEDGIKAVQKNHGEGLICNTDYKFNDVKVVENELSAIKLIAI